MFSEFKKFAMRGNVVELAVGLIVGGAFGKIVSSFVADIMMPPLGLLMGGKRFTELKLVLKAAEGESTAVTVNYGIFIQTVIDFTLIAFAVFLLVKSINKLQERNAEKPAAPPAPVITNEEKLLTEIRDLLKK